LNVTHNSTAIDTQLGYGWGTGGTESDAFWVVYLQVAYQEDASQDNDPNFEEGLTGATTAYVDGLTDSVVNSAGVPRGADGSLIFLEVMRDVEINQSLPRLRRTPAHEIGHQMGLRGDNPTGFGIMSYQDSNAYSFVPQHINILRWRIKSPGQP
jgi:hypothetical protein